MEILASRMQDEIYGEVLLFCGKSNYSEREKRLIINAISKRIKLDKEYIPLIHDFLPKLSLLIEDTAWPEDLEEKAKDVLLEISAWYSRSLDLRCDDVLYAEHLNNLIIGFKKGESYADTLRSRIINVESVKAVFDTNQANEKYGSDINFLITNNLMMSRYPSFYNEEYLDQLRSIVSTRKDKSFANLKEYWDYYKTAKITSNNISNFYTIPRIKNPEKIKKY